MSPFLEQAELDRLVGERDTAREQVALAAVQVKKLKARVYELERSRELWRIRATRKR